MELITASQSEYTELSPPSFPKNRVKAHHINKKNCINEVLGFSTTHQRDQKAVLIYQKHLTVLNITFKTSFKLTGQSLQKNTADKKLQTSNVMLFLFRSDNENI